MRAGLEQGYFERLLDEVVCHSTHNAAIELVPVESGDAADELAELVDFFSIGTNDLTQYTLAIDRQNQKLDRFFNPHHPAVLREIQMTIEAGHRHNTWVGICGELGADPELTETFVKMGIDELSMSPGSILPVRKIIREMD